MIRSGSRGSASAAVPIATSDAPTPKILPHVRRRPHPTDSDHRHAARPLDHACHREDTDREQDRVR